MRKCLRDWTKSPRGGVDKNQRHAHPFDTMSYVQWRLFEDEYHSTQKLIASGLTLVKMPDRSAQADIL